MEKENRAVLTVLGNDTTGIIAKVSAVLYRHSANILDISQTVLSGVFNMIMIVDTQKSDLSQPGLSKGLEEVGKAAGVTIHAQHEEIFNMMHRI